VKDIDESYLPETVRMVVKIIGLEKAMLLVSKFGGTQIYVGKTINQDGILARTIGVKAAIQLSKDLCYGSYLNVPKANSLQVAIRNQEIKDLKKQLSSHDLAVRFNLTERHISRIINTP